MYRNQNSHFAENPQAEISRSRFDRSHSVKFSFNLGDLIPFYIDEVLPGDTFSIDTAKLVRMQPLVTPVMDDIYLDTYYFFVPNRLVMDKWKNLMGENTDAPWIQPQDIQVPQVSAPITGWYTGTIADYMGIPVGCSNFNVSALPFRAYALIWNEWFRDENLQYPQVVNSNSLETFNGDNLSEGLTQAISGGYPLKAAKFKDYFTSCLPSPQKGPDVLLPLGTQAPVVTNGVLNDWDIYPKSPLSTPIAYPLQFMYQDGSQPDVDLAYTLFSDSALSHGVDGYPEDTPLNGKLVPSNLITDLSLATSATINQLRLAFQMQRIYEKDARGGTRYIEILANHFGVTSPDSRLQRPEYLGGNRMLINVNQVIQTSETRATPQGNVAAYSLTVDNHSDFTHSFVEHGFIIGVAVARISHSYEQGVERFWTRKNRFDYYFPSLANIGEQPVYKSEIFLYVNEEGDSSISTRNYKQFETVFGYQEAWADYRYKPNRVTSDFRTFIFGKYDEANLPITAGSLYPWTLTDVYFENPILSSEWIQEDSFNLDRALAVTSVLSNQFFADFYIKNIATRPMPLFSIPGLIDHH